MLDIINVRSTSIDKVVPLFDAYRVFYDQESNLTGAREFLEKRLINEESIILLATWEDHPVGFTQLYTTFSSVSMLPFFILNDLYVLSEYRGKGVGAQLLNAAKDLCRDKKFKGIALETALNNPAQKLYEKLAWKKDVDYFHYFWTNSN